MGIMALAIARVLLWQLEWNAPDPALRDSLTSLGCRSCSLYRHPFPLRGCARHLPLYSPPSGVKVSVWKAFQAA
jgi:hypothetical protein